MAWQVAITQKAAKGLAKLPSGAKKALALLMADIESKGPIRGDWPNYSNLAPHCHHCHIKKGQPTYVAVWEEVAGKIKLIEVVYAGSHEKAPY
jgi:mRNA-degrading endonuclease RelE of RelBE toxin-antitoxin system